MLRKKSFGKKISLFSCLALYKLIYIFPLENLVPLLEFLFVMFSVYRSTLMTASVLLDGIGLFFNFLLLVF